MNYRLLHQGNDVRLAEGEYLIGRGPQCSIQLDDPTVSRQHAILRIAGALAELEDLGSRNGLTVNGRSVSGRLQLRARDRIRIGRHDLVLVEGGPSRSNDTTAKERANPPEETLSLLGELADKALVLGNDAEAERILGHYLEAVLHASRIGERPSTVLYRAAVQYAARLACHSRRARWLNYVFELANVLEIEVPAEAIERLYDAASHLESGGIQQLEAYVSSQRLRRNAMTPRQRFVLGRAEGLLRRLQP
ncbi:MAG TPA: FHA domain-containing protein [Polyangiaceae bacterium]|jgi:hypothetical protein|nr:FHA domain-containing protein [Polyangiaceae bacterium]